MKKVIGTTVLLATGLIANGDIYLNSGVKSYSHSKTKVDGKTNSVGTSYQYKQNFINLNYTKDMVNREHPKTKKSIEQLNVKKYNFNYKYTINDALRVKASYIKILDNLAPTDQGKVYGLGVKYNFMKGLGTSFDLYKSDYKTFDVNQYDFSIFKGFKIGDIQSKFTLLVKKIEIDGEKYAGYSFQEKDYLTTAIKLNGSYNGYVGGLATFFGKRAFTILKDGAKVQHHAMEQDKTYMLSFGKKFQNFDLIASYSFQNGKELPENQEDVDTKITSILLKYKF